MKISFKDSRNLPLLGFFTALLWGSAPTFIKLGYRVNDISATDVSSQILFAGMRFTLAGVILIILKSLLNKHFEFPHESGKIQNIIRISLFSTVEQYICYYIGLGHASATYAAILAGLYPIATILGAIYIFKVDKLSVRKIGAGLLGLMAVVFLNFSNISMGGNLSFLGEGLLLLSLVGNLVGNNLIKIYSKNDDPIVIAGWQFFLGGLLLCLIGRMTGGTIHLDKSSGIVIFLYLALLSAIAQACWNKLLQYHPIAKVAIYSAANPVFGLIFSVLLLREIDEVFQIYTLIALCFVCIGIWIANSEE